MEFYLPDTIADWPWPRQLNSLYEEVAPASAAWLESFGVFSQREQEAFDSCNFGELLPCRISSISNQ